MTTTNLLAFGFNTLKFSPFVQVDKDYSAYQQGNYRIADAEWKKWEEELETESEEED